MSDDGEDSERQWRVHGVMEAGGLRVLGIRPFPGREYRWTVDVLADETAVRDLRELTGVDVVRYQHLGGVPGRLVVTVDEPRPDPTPLGSRRSSPRRRRDGSGR